PPVADGPTMPPDAPAGNWNFQAAFGTPAWRRNEGEPLPGPARPLRRGVPRPPEPERGGNPPAGASGAWCGHVHRPHHPRGCEPRPAPLRAASGGAAGRTQAPLLRDSGYGYPRQPRDDAGRAGPDPGRDRRGPDLL